MANKFMVESNNYSKQPLTAYFNFDLSVYEKAYNSESVLTPKGTVNSFALSGFRVSQITTNNINLTGEDLFKEVSDFDFIIIKSDKNFYLKILKESLNDFTIIKTNIFITSNIKDFSNQEYVESVIPKFFIANGTLGLTATGELYQIINNYEEQSINIQILKLTKG